MTQVLFRPAAIADIEEARGWYELQRPGLGQAFLESVDSVVAAVLENRRMSPVLHRDTRRALLRRFPFGLFYRLVEDRVVVVACLHAKRDPKTWRSRTRAA